MGSREVVVREQPRAKGKHKNGEGRNRRVLGDIGNLVTTTTTLPTVQAKPPQNQPSHPITRSSCVQLLANAEAADSNKNPQAEDANGRGSVNKAVGRKDWGATKAAAVQNKQYEQQPEPKAAIPVVDEEKIKAEEEEATSVVASSRRRLVTKAFTSVLAARSKAACGLTTLPKDPIPNIDASDLDNELAVVEYVEDIYKFYKISEHESRFHHYMDSQPEINAKMRSILMDWLTEVHRKFELMPETLYHTFNIVDRYLSVKSVSRRELQLVGISSMLIACKYEEIWAPEVNDFIAISDKAYVREQILRMEKAILGELQWCLTIPTPYVFLVRYIKASVPSDQEMENMVFFLTELSLMHYSTVILYCPSMIAAAAVYAARCTLNKHPLWTKTLKHHTGYSEDQLRECAKLLMTFHSAAVESKLKAVCRKFSSPDRGSVALFHLVNRNLS